MQHKLHQQHTGNPKVINNYYYLLLTSTSVMAVANFFLREQEGTRSAMRGICLSIQKHSERHVLVKPPLFIISRAYVK